MFIANTRGAGPTIVMQGVSYSGVGSTYQFYKTLDLHEVSGADPIATCCRESVLGDQPPLTAFTHYLMSARWAPSSWAVFGDQPQPRADGTMLYEVTTTASKPSSRLARPTSPRCPRRLRSAPERSQYRDREERAGWSLTPIRAGAGPR